MSNVTTLSDEELLAQARQLHSQAKDALALSKELSRQNVELQKAQAAAIEECHKASDARDPLVKELIRRATEPLDKKLQDKQINRKEYARELGMITLRINESLNT